MINFVVEVRFGASRYGVVGSGADLHGIVWCGNVRYVMVR